MIAANAQSGTSGFSKVSPVGVVHIVGPFRCFEVNVGDVRASNHALPVNGALVMRNVNALFVFRVDISLMRIKRHALRSQGVAVLYGPYRHGVGFKHGANVFTSMFVAVFFLPKASLGTSKTENKSVKMNMFCGLVMFSWRLKQSQIYSFPDY